MCQEEIITRHGRRGSQSDDLSAKVGCLDCTRLLGPKYKSVECDNCNNRVCMACSGLSDAKFEAISEDRSDMIWFCRHCRIALPGMKNIVKSISKLDKSHTASIGKHYALERRVEVLEERKTQGSSLTKTIKEEVQEAMLRERKKTAIIVRGIPNNGKNREAIRHARYDGRVPTNATADTTMQTKHRGKSRPINIECENTDQKCMMLNGSKH